MTALHRRRAAAIALLAAVIALPPRWPSVAIGAGAADAVAALARTAADPSRLHVDVSIRLEVLP